MEAEAAPSDAPRRYRGSCHCGALTLVFETRRPLRPRACQCSFCRRHSARTVSDPEGRATIRLAVPLEAAAYLFASRQASYLTCPRCGVYLGATIATPEGSFATLNLNAFDERHPELEAQPVCYEGQSAAEKRARRIGLWTPATVAAGGGAQIAPSPPPATAAGLGRPAPPG
ncbi:MAG TPA: hypothetical protein VEA61_08535 [Allosphingosinicella sp.]|nr:hypothetical protein [Allosphingosinicella sp.]